MSFPSSPSVGQTHTSALGLTHIFTADGAWRILAGIDGSFPTAALGFLWNDGSGAMAWVAQAVQPASVAVINAGLDDTKMITAAGFRGRTPINTLRRNSGGQTIASGVYTTLLTDQLSGSLDDTTYLSGVFTVGTRTAGLWLITANFDSTGNAAKYVEIIHNGSRVSYAGGPFDAGTSAVTVPNVSTIISAVAGDTFAVRVRQDTGASQLTSVCNLRCVHLNS